MKSIDDFINVALKNVEELFPWDLEMKMQDNPDILLLDVREPYEFKSMHIEGAINIPLEELRLRYPQLDPEQEYFTYCTYDSRGMAAAFLLVANGFNAKNLRGGLSALRAKRGAEEHSFIKHQQESKL